jgi:Mrp family chromosome partitioning ATPase
MPQDVALADVQKGIAMFRKISVPVGTDFAENIVQSQR